MKALLVIVLLIMAWRLTVWKNNKRRKQFMENISRQSRLDLNEPAELAIYNAMVEVEKIGADARLTEAVIKLSEAKKLVGDFIDDQKKKGE